MGVVHAAYDPELDRKIAIKLMHTGVGDDGASLLREAQAMARLAHENVVTVFEVGTYRGRGFVAMELVDGPNLGQWLAAGPRPWGDVVDRFIQAGRGLAAAHAAGLVHHDFKPHNVLGDRDGRMRVSDFGLARRRAGDQDAAPGATIAVGGTLAYMAPEQLAGAPADERSDQFSFCVGLWEGLCGERPFAGDDARTILHAIESTAVREGRGGAPARVIRLVRRGLALDPAARHASMGALVASLVAERGRNRRTTWAVVGGLVLALGALSSLVLAGGADEDRCERPTARLTGVWDSARRAGGRLPRLPGPRRRAGDRAGRAQPRWLPRKLARSTRRILPGDSDRRPVGGAARSADRMSRRSQA
jgi:eukaryotic-like serine/threonine-protein kinase